MNEDEKQDIAGLDIGNLPVNQENSDENPEDKENENTESDDKSAEGAHDTSVEENKVSYSRLKKIN